MEKIARYLYFPLVLNRSTQETTRQVYNLFQEPVEQPSLGFSIAEEKQEAQDFGGKKLCILTRTFKTNVQNER